MRRATIGGAMVEGKNHVFAWLYVLTNIASAMIEYSLDLDLPDVVFENPIIKAMSDATTDLMTWPNVCHLFVPYLDCGLFTLRLEQDLCSFNVWNQ